MDSFEDISTASKLLLLVSNKKLHTYVIVICASVFISLTISYFIFSNNKQENTVGTNNLKDEVIKSDSIAVDISGSVAKPGVYEVLESTRLGDVISLSGGLTPDTYFEWVSKNLNLSTKIIDSQKIYIPFIWEKEYSLVEIQPLEKQIDIVGQNVVKSDTVDAATISINVASQEELESLPGIGPTYASKIISERPFTDYDDFVLRSSLPQSTKTKIVNLISY